MHDDSSTLHLHTYKASHGYKSTAETGVKRNKWMLIVASAEQPAPFAIYTSRAQKLSQHTGLLLLGIVNRAIESWRGAIFLKALYRCGDIHPHIHLA